MLRRGLAWTAVCLLFAYACALVVGHLHLPKPSRCVMPARAADMGVEGPMSYPWPRGQINPNEATTRELEQLNGVGPAAARAIVRERETNGWFRYPEDLLSVPGIGPVKLGQMWEQLYLPQPNHQ